MMEVMTGMDSDERLWEARLVADVADHRQQERPQDQKV